MPAATPLLVLRRAAGLAPCALLAEQVRGWRGTQGLAFHVRGTDVSAVPEVVDRLVDAGFGTVIAVL